MQILKKLCVLRELCGEIVFELVLDSELLSEDFVFIHEPLKILTTHFRCPRRCRDIPAIRGELVSEKLLLKYFQHVFTRFTKDRADNRDVPHSRKGRGQNILQCVW